MKVLCVPDKFRGTATASEIVSTVTRVASAKGFVVDGAPMADGGEGTLEAFGGEFRLATVTGPLGTPIKAQWSLIGTKAVIEMSRASGWIALDGDINDPLAATTAGTGELIALALDAGATEIVVGCGGSVTTDGGQGAVEALKGRRSPKLTILTDVDAPFLAAATIYGPQKGATPDQVELLVRRLSETADDYLREFGVDVHSVTGAGAAGGLAGGLAAIGGTIHSGFSYIAESVALKRRIADCDVVITGEGSFDSQSIDGKVVGGVLELAHRYDKPVLLVAGIIDNSVVVADSVTTVSLSETYGIERARGDTLTCVEEAVDRYLSHHM